MAHLIRRMMYVAEASSVGLRLNASWALTHPGFSLCRDRYEQCVRFSWLAGQNDAREWYRYIADYYLTRHRLKNAFDQNKVAIPVDLDDGLAEAPAYVRERFASGETPRSIRWRGVVTNWTESHGAASIANPCSGSTTASIDRAVPLPIMTYIVSTCWGFTTGRTGWFSRPIRTCRSCWCCTVRSSTLFSVRKP